MDRQAKIASIFALVLATLVIAVMVTAMRPDCRDGADNDNDGLVDFGRDPGCGGENDRSENADNLVCDNGKDEGWFEGPTADADGLADFRLSRGDPGCTSPGDPTEIDGECDDMRDNDGDGHTDYPGSSGDSKCMRYADNEAPADSCSDTDGGNSSGTKGTVSGYQNDVLYHLDDVCISMTLPFDPNPRLREYYCGNRMRDYDPLSSTIDCTRTGRRCIAGACV